MVCVHHAGSAHRARNVSINRSSSLPEATSRGRNSATVCRQYTAQASHRYNALSLPLARTSFSPSPDSIAGSRRPMK